jgi:hypothetical protein
VLLGRRVALAVAAVLCLSLVVGVLGTRSAGAAAPTQSAVTVTVTVSPPTEVFGVLDQVFSVTIAPPSTGDDSPTGVVTVSDLQVNLCPPITLPSPGVGAVTVICADSTVAIPVNASTIAQYSYSGDQNYQAAKGKVSGTVTAADTSTSVIASSGTSTWGSEQSLVFAAVVTNAQPGSVGVPTGEVSVEQGADVLCTITLSNGAGTCSPAPTALAPGTDSVTASYSGDPNFNPSPLSTPISPTISPAPLLVAGNDAATAYGSPQPTFGSTLSGFVNGQTQATSGVTGQSQCTTTATTTSPVGSYPITCTAGTLAASDYSFGFAPGTLTVSQAPTTLSLSPPSTTGSSLTATVTSQFSGTPTGSVTFHVGTGTVSCALSSVTAGSASCTANLSPNIPPGSYFVPVTYSGDADFKGSSSGESLIVPGLAATGDPGTGAGAGSGTGAGTGSGPGGVRGTNPTISASTGGSTEINTVSAASLASSAQTYAADVSVSQQNATQQTYSAYLKKYLAYVLQQEANAAARHPVTAAGSATSGSAGASVPLRGANAADRLNQPATATGGSATNSGGTSGDRVHTSVVAGKSGSMVLTVLLTLVLALSLLTAIAVRGRTRRTAGVSAGDNGGRSVTNGD